VEPLVEVEEVPLVLDEPDDADDSFEPDDVEAVEDSLEPEVPVSPPEPDVPVESPEEPFLRPSWRLSVR